MAVFNILNLVLSDTTIIHLQGPDGAYLYADAAEKEPMQVEVYGRSSKQMRNYLAKSEEKKAKRNRAFKPTPEQSLEDNADFFAAITKSIINFDLGKGALKTTEDFKEVYMNPGLYWIGDAISATLGDTELFMQR